MLALECVPSRLPADPTCEDALKELSDQVAKPTSTIYNGIVTWALDPLFPKGTAKIDPITGKAYVEGSCSDSRFFTEATCLSAGFCQCNIGPDREGDNVREKCEASFYPGGKQCRFVPYNDWSDDGVTTLRFGKCSDPTKASKEECLEEGTCSNPKLKGRKACLREGYCTGTWCVVVLTNTDETPTCSNTGTGQSKDVDFSQFLTREECEDPDKRSNIDVVEPGYCTARRGAKGKALHFNFRQFRNKAHCENPESRKKPIDLGTPSPKRECGTCKQGGNPKEISPFQYSNFKTKETCENPPSRNLPVTGACAMRDSTNSDQEKNDDKQYDGM